MDYKKQKSGRGTSSDVLANGRSTQSGLEFARKAGEFIRPFRSTAVAHLRVDLDKAANTYRLPSLPALNELYTTIEEILPIITRSVADLAAILVGGGDRLNLFERRAKQNAAIFWGIKCTPVR